MLLANILSIFPLKGKPVCSNGPKILPRNHLDSRILSKSVFDIFLLAKELFAKDLQNFETCVLVNNNL